MSSMRFLVVAVVCALAVSACGSGGSKTKSSGTQTTAAPTPTTAASSAVVKTADTKLGAVLVDAQGRTLYHRTDETATHIVCVDKCATTWPPLFAQGNATPSAGPGVPALTVAMRPDGKDQVAAAGQPLYTFAGDTSAGDTNGEGVAGIWHVVKAEAAGTQPPAGATATTAKPTATTTGSYSGH